MPSAIASRCAPPACTSRARPLNLACRATAEKKPSVTQRLGLAVATAAATIGLAASPAFAGVSFVTPADGAILESPVALGFAVDGMEVRPAKDGLIPATGHFHVLINEGPAKQGEALPFDDQHLHFGKGQLEAKVDLPKGTNKLTLQFADANHNSYGPEWSSTVSVVID